MDVIDLTFAQAWQTGQNPVALRSDPQWISKLILPPHPQSHGWQLDRIMTVVNGPCRVIALPRGMLIVDKSWLAELQLMPGERILWQSHQPARLIQFSPSAQEYLINRQVILQGFDLGFDINQPHLLSYWLSHHLLSLYPLNLQSAINQRYQLHTSLLNSRQISWQTPVVSYLTNESF